MRSRPQTDGERPCAKFQPPTNTGLAMHKGQTTVQNKGNANIYVDFSFLFLLQKVKRVTYEILPCSKISGTLQKHSFLYLQRSVDSSSSPVSTESVRIPKSGGGM